MRHNILSLRDGISKIVPLRIVKNASFLSVANISLKLAGLIIGVMIARALGERQFGAFALGMAYSGLSLSVAQLGLNVLVRREVARNYALTGAYVGRLLPLLLVSIAVTFLVVTILLREIGYPVDTRQVITLVFLAQAFETLSSLCLAVFVAHERMKWVAVVEGAAFAAKVVCAALLLLNGAQLTVLLLGFLLISATKFAVELTIVFRLFARFRLSIDIAFWKQALGQSLPIAATVAPSFVLLRADTIILSILKGGSAVGQYNAAYSLFVGLDIVPRSLFGAVFPRLAAAHVRSVKRSYYFYRRSVLAMGIIGGVLGFALFVMAEPIIMLLYGPEFGQSVGALRILALSVPIFFVSSTCKGALNAVDQQVANMYIVLGAAVFNVVLNLLIIPRLSFIGASISTGLTYALTATLTLAYASYYFGARIQGENGQPVVSALKTEGR